MNYSMAIFLINNNARGIMGVYESDANAKRTLFKTLDPSIKTDDFCIVGSDTRHGMTVVKVVETDVEPDLDSNEQVKWIIGRIDRSAYDEMLQQEAAAIQAIKSAEMRKKRDDMRKALLADHVEKLKALPLAELNGDAMPEKGE